jgi:DoxX
MMPAIDSFLATWSPRVLSILRIMVGLLFLEHGMSKYLSLPVSPSTGVAPMSLSGINGMIELVGGVLIVLGLFTRPGHPRHHRHRAKGIESDPQHEHLRSGRFVRSNHCSHERGHARQYRRVVVAHARLAGSQSASRAWLWPTAVVAPRLTRPPRRQVRAGCSVR